MTILINIHEMSKDQAYLSSVSYLRGRNFMNYIVSESFYHMFLIF